MNQQEKDKIVRKLIDTNTTISTMESCTSGLIASMITDTEGASAVFPGGYVTYLNKTKILCGVDEKIIKEHGVYSKQCARSMAETAQKNLHTEIAVGITGTTGNVDPNNADSMQGKVFFCILVISLFLNKAASYGQEIQVSRDTVKVSVQEGNTSPHNERSITPKPLDIRKAVDLSSGSCPSRITFDVQNPYNPTFPTDKSPLHEGEYSTSGIIKSYPSGYFYGIGRQENFIGLGTMNYAGIGYVYSPGCWSFNLQAYTVKWSVPRRESQLLGLSGLLTYPVNEKIRLNTFASYSFILSSPFSSSNYGGFVSYDIIPNWGMDFGVRSHTDFPLHKTKTLPIVAPYFQYKGNKLGIDIGGGLFNLLFK